MKPVLGDIAVLILILVIGFVTLPYPFSGDQALFTIGAAKIGQGAVLYRDFWDMKQPGIFAFYWAAGALFGLNEVGVHALELIYLLCFSGILIFTLRHYFDTRWAASGAPLVVLGLYFTIPETLHRSQVEALAGFPLFLCCWFLSRAPLDGPDSLSRSLISGLTGGIALLYKLMFLPILGGFLIVALVNQIRDGGSWRLAMRRTFFPFAAGLLLPLVSCVFYFAGRNALPELWEANFDYPIRALTELSHAGNPILPGLIWMLRQFSIVIAFAVLGMAAPPVRLRRFTVNLALWSVLGFVVIFLQSYSRWSYHYMLLLVPLGILATRGLELVVTRMREAITPLPRWLRPAAGLICVGVLFSPQVYSLGRCGLQLVRQGFAMTAAQQRQYQNSFSNSYATILQEVSFLSDPASLPGKIYVLGDPLFILLSGRDQAVPINGWFTDMVLPRQWVKLAQDLRNELPPYILVDVFSGETIQKHSSDMVGLLADNYDVLRISNQGTWYVRKGDAANP